MAIVSGVLLIDQIIKIWVKTSMTLGENIHLLGSYFQLYFIENNGMAFGMELGGDYGKLALSLFRVVAVFGLGYLLYDISRKKSSVYLIVALSLVLAGALGNIIDSIFYGVIFSESGLGTEAVLFPAEGGYSTLLHGRVVDMFYMELINLKPEDATWLPGFLFGGDGRFVFFRPIFNFADASISIGVAIILLFQKRIFESKPKPEVAENEQ